MILGDTRLRMESLVSPMTKNSIQPASIDLHVGDHFLAPIHKPFRVIGGGRDKRVEYDEFKSMSDGMIIPAHGFVLGRTIEVFKMPTNLCAFIEGRSSTGRQGLFVQNAGFTDPGFEGTITLELFNALPFPVILMPGERIAQAVFVEVDGCETPYSGKYQKQIDATGAIADAARQHQ